MIQATDFVCPVCRAQVGQICMNQAPAYVYGKMIMKPTTATNKPHPERRRLAAAKRAANAIKESK